MRISCRNWLCDPGAYLDFDSTGSVGSEYQTIPYVGVPVRLFTTGTHGYDLVTSRPITCIGLLGVRYKSFAYGSTYTLTVKVYSGGIVQHTENFTFKHQAHNDLYDSQVVEIAQVFGDYVEITISASMFGVVIMIDRIWVGEIVELDEVNQYTVSIIDNAKLEQNAVGGSQKVDVLMYRQVSVSNAQIHDNMETDGTPEDTDLEAVMSMFAYASMNKELCVFPLGCMDAFHGRFIEAPSIKKQTGNLYLSNIKIKEF